MYKTIVYSFFFSISFLNAQQDTMSLKKAYEILKSNPNDNKNPRPLIYRALCHLFTKAQQSNNPITNDYLAGLYYAGHYVPQSYTKAFNFYLKAAKLGYGPSQCHVGLMLKKGEGVDKNLSYSYYYLLKASANKKDLEDLTHNAKQWALDVAQNLSQTQRQEVFRMIGRNTHP